MAEYEPAYEKTILNEGGYKLHNVPGDTGGMTYAGITRKWNPSWLGWEIIDRGDMGNSQLTQMVRDFYKINFWDKVKGDDLARQETAETIFDFAVNTGLRVASKLAQLAVGATPDGAIGPITVQALNAEDAETFEMKFAIAKVARYASICNNDRSQNKFLLGWINRTLEVMA